jgi:hypothetical protein
MFLSTQHSKEQQETNKRERKMSSRKWWICFNQQVLLIVRLNDFVEIFAIP